MPVVPINYLAITACGILSMILGSLWYGPLFGKQWIALSGISMANVDPAAMKRAMIKAYATTFVGSLVMAYVLSHSLIFASSFLGVSGISAGLMSGFWSWLGFVAPVTLGTVLWEGKSWKLWFLNNGYNFVQLLLMGVVLAVWR